LLASLFLLVLLVSAPIIPVTAPPRIWIDPWSKVGHDNFVIYVYPSLDSDCPNMDSVEKLLGPTLDLILSIHRDASLRFVSEFGYKYDGLLLLRFEKTSDKQRADIKIYVKEISPDIAYYATSKYSKEILVDCEVADASLNDQVSVLLHELYHGLGVGHIEPNNEYDLMGGVGRYNMYPTSLDLYAIWLVWFSGKYDNAPPSGGVIWVTLPDEIEYVQLEPFSSTINRLLSQNEDLKATVFDLRRDIKNLGEERDMYRREVENLTSVNEALRQEVSDLERTVNDLGRKLAEREETIGRLNDKVSSLSNELSNANAKITSLESQVEKLESLRSSLESENELLRARIDSLRWILLVLVVTFVCTAISLAVVWRTRKK
jgi:prefoldin subunit 5